MRSSLFLALALCGLCSPACAETSWIFRPAEFSHDPYTCARVDQYAAPEPSYVRGDGTYQQSAYRHIESSIRVGNSADRFHIVETWGEGESLRPYGEWQYPFRPGATPWSVWVNPWGPWGGGWGGGVWGGGGWGGGGWGGNPGNPWGPRITPFGQGQLSNPPWSQGYVTPSMPPLATPLPSPTPYGGPRGF